MLQLCQVQSWSHNCLRYSPGPITVSGTVLVSQLSQVQSWFYNCLRYSPGSTTISGIALVPQLSQVQPWSITVSGTALVLQLSQVQPWSITVSGTVLMAMILCNVFREFIFSPCSTLHNDGIDFQPHPPPPFINTWSAFDLSKNLKAVFTVHVASAPGIQHMDGCYLLVQ